jgi:ADP-heptose:LPS heptosyltransferase
MLSTAGKNEIPDSQNAHIAAMLGVKVITLWGATHPYAGFHRSISL